MYDEKTKEMILDNELNERTNKVLARGQSYIIGYCGVVWIICIIVIFAFGLNLPNGKLVTLVLGVTIICVVAAIALVKIYRFVEFDRVKEIIKNVGYYH